jgi:hypothetical protein
MQQRFDEDEGTYRQELDIEIEYIEPVYMYDYYFKMAYFVTTTLTTVGYGDYSATKNNMYSKVMMSVILATGLLAFSLISNNILSYESIPTVQRQI